MRRYREIKARCPPELVTETVLNRAGYSAARVTHDENAASRLRKLGAR